MLILHIDMDSYFASVEQQANPVLRGRPIVVSGRPDIYSVVAAASKEAKRHGVRSGMTTWEAKRLCPNVVFVPGDPAKYETLTRRFFDLLLRYTPMVEVYSIDEVFLEISQEASHYGGALALARRIQREFREALGGWITCSIGIAPNKMLAKLAVEKAKPAGVRVVEPEEVSSLLSKTPVGEVCGIGPRIVRRLSSLGVVTVADLTRVSEVVLQREFGVYGRTLALWGRGLDPTPLVPYWQIPEAKSIGHSHALPRALRDPSGARNVLFFLCERTGRDLRANRFAGRVVHFSVRDREMRYRGGQRALEVATDDEEKIFRTALDLCEAFGGFPEESSLVAVRVSGLATRGGMPVPLFARERGQERLLSAMDRIRDRYGESAIWRGSTYACRALVAATGGMGRQQEIARARRRADGAGSPSRLAGEDGGRVGA